MQALEHRIPPPLVAIIIVIAMWGLARVSATLTIDLWWRVAVAAAVALPAPFLGRSGLRAFARARTTFNPVRIDEATALVTTGVYARTRNPMYLGLTLLLCAWAVGLAAPWALLGPAAFVAFITRFQIIPEERALAARFGADYAAYRQRVRRWI